MHPTIPPWVHPTYTRCYTGHRWSTAESPLQALERRVAELTVSDGPVTDPCVTDPCVTDSADHAARAMPYYARIMGHSPKGGERRETLCADSSPPSTRFTVGHC